MTRCTHSIHGRAPRVMRLTGMLTAGMLLCASVLAGGTMPGASVARAQTAEPTTFADAPAGTEALAARLRARHRRDLPAPEELADATNGARLRWLAEHHPLAMVRARALLLLAVHHDAATRALVLRVLDSEEPVIVRAAALRATDGWPLEAGLARRMRRLADERDPRLAEPARKRLERH